MLLWWSLFTLYVLTYQVRFRVGNSGLCCVPCLLSAGQFAPRLFVLEPFAFRLLVPGTFTRTLSLDHSPPDCLSLGHSPPDCLSRGHLPPDCLSRGHSPPDCLSRGHLPPDCLSLDHWPPDCPWTIGPQTLHPIRGAKGLGMSDQWGEWPGGKWFRDEWSLGTTVLIPSDMWITVGSPVICGYLLMDPQ